MAAIPPLIPNWIAGHEEPALSGRSLAKYSPHSGAELCRLARSGAEDVSRAVEAAREVQPGWAATPAVRRGMALFAVAEAMRASRHEIAAIVAAETGKSPGDALGETEGAIQLALFHAGEGQRLYGRTTTSGAPNKFAMTVRRPVGVAGLIIAANTPIANVAWKLFPALICGNGVVLKAPEDTPATAWIMGRILHEAGQEAGIPAGLVNIVQGLGHEAGEPIVTHPEVGVVSFTGSSGVGRRIAALAGERLAKVSLELGGKNPLVVCDDADAELACRWVMLSAFSNAGQRCAACSRIIVFENVFKYFKTMCLEAVAKLTMGPKDGNDLGPVVNERQLNNILAAIAEAKARGAQVLCGGVRAGAPEWPELAGGYYMTPTLIEGAAPSDPISRRELFGPVACLYSVKDFAEAVDLVNDCDYGLTASIHTRNVHRAMAFAERVQAGVIVTNAGTYGSEPHMPFGGFKASGNGSREPGTEALDVYSELQDVYMISDPGAL